MADFIINAVISNVYIKDISVVGMKCILTGGNNYRYYAPTTISDMSPVDIRAGESKLVSFTFEDDETYALGHNFFNPNNLPIGDYEYNIYLYGCISGQPHLNYGYHINNLIKLQNIPSSVVFEENTTLNIDVIDVLDYPSETNLDFNINTVITNNSNKDISVIGMKCILTGDNGYRYYEPMSKLDMSPVNIQSGESKLVSFTFEGDETYGCRFALGQNFINPNNLPIGDYEYNIYLYGCISGQPHPQYGYHIKELIKLQNISSNVIFDENTTLNINVIDVLNYTGDTVLKKGFFYAQQTLPNNYNDYIGGIFIDSDNKVNIYKGGILKFTSSLY